MSSSSTSSVDSSVGVTPSNATSLYPPTLSTPSSSPLSHPMLSSLPSSSPSLPNCSFRLFSASKNSFKSAASAGSISLTGTSPSLLTLSISNSSLISAPGANASNSSSLPSSVGVSVPPSSSLPKHPISYWWGSERMTLRSLTSLMSLRSTMSSSARGRL